MNTLEYKLYYPGCELADDDWFDYLSDMEQQEIDAPTEEEMEEMYWDRQQHLNNDEGVLPF